MNFKRVVLSILAIIACLALVVLNTNSKAITYSELKNWEGGPVTVTESEDEDGTIVMDLNTDASLDIVINDGEKVILNLNGHTLTNYTDACEAIKVMEGGELTILDSEGSGKVTHKTTSTFGAITNRGTLTIKSGVFEGVIYDGGNESVDDTDVLYNLGTCVIEGGVFTSPSSETSLIHCLTEGSLTGNLTIKNGTFTSNVANVAAYSGAEVTIEGGVFDGRVIYASGRPTVSITDSGLTSRDPSEFARWNSELYYWETEDGTMELKDRIDVSTLGDSLFTNPDPAVELYATGSEIKPDIIVSIDGIKYDGLFTVEYEGTTGNLIDPGLVTYTVTFTEGKYKGSTKGTYMIENPRVNVNNGQESQVMVIGAGKLDLQDILSMGNGKTLVEARPVVTMETNGIIDVDANYLVTALSAGTVNVSVGNAQVFFKVIDASTDVEAGIPSIDLTVTPSETVIGVTSEDQEDTKTVLTTSLDTLRETNENVNMAVANALTAGQTVSVDIVIQALEESGVDADIINAMRATLSDNNISDGVIADYFNIGVDITANGTKIGYIDQLNRSVKLTVAIPEDLQKTDTSDGKTRLYYIIRIHQEDDGTYTTSLIATTPSDNGKTVSFRTDKFSTYALAYVDVDNGQIPDQPVIVDPNDPENPVDDENNNNNNNNDNNEDNNGNNSSNEENQGEGTDDKEETLQPVDGDVTEEVKEKLNVPSPKTGDNIVTIIITLAVAFVGFMAIVIAKYRTKKKND